MSDRIALRGVRVFGRHGADPGERDIPQPFDVDLELDIDLGAAAASDELADTYDYAALHARVRDIVASERFALIERLAGVLLDAVFTDGRVSGASVTVAKPGKLDGATPSVTIRRSR